MIHTCINRPLPGLVHFFANDDSHLSLNLQYVFFFSFTSSFQVLGFFVFFFAFEIKLYDTLTTSAIVCHKTRYFYFDK